MFSETAIYLRTGKGLREIQHKTHDLTQSERLVLILVDGVTPCAGLRDKLKGLAEDRFHRALQSILKKDLVVEALVPLENAESEKLDSKVVDRFLRQDPLDPITIISLEPQAELSVNGMGEVKAGTYKGPESGVTESMQLKLRPGISKVDFYLPLERAIMQPVLDVRSSPVVEGRLHMISTPSGSRRRDSAGKRRREARSRKVQLGYWLLFVGLVFIILFVALHNTR